MNILITICARGGSKGIPGKNIKKIGGIPLIAYTIGTANKVKQKFSTVDIALSTDSDEIMAVAAKYGLLTPYKRPETLGGDTVGKVDVIRDVLSFYEKTNGIKYDYVLDMDVTSPLRTLEDIENALNILYNDKKALNIFSVSEPNRNPYFNMVEEQESGYYSTVKSLDSGFFTRQSSPKVYDMNASFYIYRRTFFEDDNKGAITNRSLIYIVPHICFDLDHPIDFDMMSYLLENNKLDFTL